MSIINQKTAIFADISAKKTLLEGFPKLLINSSFPSINNASNPLSFLTDLLSTLVGVESLKQIVIDTLTTNLPNIETSIKLVLKKSLNSLVSCQINPSIPPQLLHSGKGINIEVSKIDFNNILLTDPNSDFGGLLYDDIESGIDSKDFNTFLYNVIQLGGKHTWAKCLELEFIESGVINNILNIKVSKTFTDSGKNLKDLNNLLVDSIELLNVSDILNKLMDGIFGMISVEQNKSKNQLINELKVNQLIESIMNQEDEETIDDSFFEFDNETLQKLEIDADNKQKGIKVVETSKRYNLKGSINNLKDVSYKLKNSNDDDLATILSKSLDDISNEITDAIPNIDKYSVKLDFINDLVKGLMVVIGNIIISPKIISIMVINHNIIYGETYDDSIDFMKKNKYFIKEIFNEIRDIVIKLIMDRVLKEIEILALNSAAELMAEQISTTTAIMSSLVGVPLNITRQISGVIKR